jgi:glycosyltransferase involved in cell wall biosynthesis
MPAGSSAAQGGGPLRIWLVAVGEPLPTDPGHLRLLRAGSIAAMLRDRGHRVVWWTSAFDHQTKRMREAPSGDAIAGLGYEIRLLRGCGYARNVSLARLRDQRLTAAAFERQIVREAPPDLILCSYPTIELCAAAVRFGRARGVPVVVDARDMWPDIFVNLAPGPLRGLARLALAPMFRASRHALSGATALIGITDAFVDWACARAGRARSPLDRSFPLAYDLGQVAPEALDRARAAWTDRGVVPGDRTVCFFGTLGRQFDIPTVLRAAAALRAQGIRFVICGAGDRFEEYRRLAQGLDNVLFPGWVDAAAIRTLMERSVAGIAPYFNEHSFTLSIPNKAIEYLAGGLPILTCLGGELRALVERGGCGVYWPEGDDAALRTAVEALACDPQRRQRMADNSRLVFSENFEAGAVYGRLVDHVCELARRHRPDPDRRRPR